MHTMLIRVVNGQDGGYVVELLVDDGSGAWDPRLMASEPLPADLAPNLAPGALGTGPLHQAVINFVRDNEQTSAFGPIGDWLAGLLLRASVGAAWDAEVAAGARFRTLIDVELEKLGLLPWELMRRQDVRLFTDAARPFARVHSLEPDDTQDLVPLRLLVVEGTRDKQLGTAVELGGITSALPEFGGRVDARFLTEPTPTQLWDAFHTPPHIFHFVGHGLIDGYTKQPALRVGDWLLTRDHILNVMPNAPRVVVLNACRTGEGDVGQVQALTAAFLERRVAAVIGMQGDVRGKSAARFGVELYRALGRNKLIDEAVTLARRTVYGEFGVVAQQRDWALPSLTLRVRPERVLPVTCGASLTKADLERIDTHLFEPTKLFIDRIEERAQLVSAVDPEDGPPKRLLLVLGDIQVGKTWLVTWVRTRCALRGRRVRYVDFRGPRNLGFLQALDVIRETAEDVASLAPSRSGYDRYDYDLGFLLQGQMPPEAGGGAQHIGKPAIPAVLSLGEAIVGRIFESFRAALERETEQQPLLLIFDHVGGLFRDDFLNYVYPLLIKKIGDDEIPNVRVLVVLSAEQRRDYWPPDEARVWSEVPVNLIDPERYEEFALEILQLMGIEMSQDHLDLISAYRRVKIKKSPWSPAALKGVLDAVRA